MFGIKEYKCRIVNTAPGRSAGGAPDTVRGIRLILILALCLTCFHAPSVRAEELLQIKRPPAMAPDGQALSPKGRAYDIVADILSRGVDGEGRKFLVAGDVSFYLAPGAAFYAENGEAISENLFTKRRMVGLMLDKQKKVRALYLLTGDASPSE